MVVSETLIASWVTVAYQVTLTLILGLIWRTIKQRFTMQIAYNYVLWYYAYLQFKFIIEEGVALPVDPAFWDYLISTSQREWSLLVYEQDWLYVQFIRTKALQVG